MAGCAGVWVVAGVPLHSDASFFSGGQTANCAIAVVGSRCLILPSPVSGPLQRTGDEDCKTVNDDEDSDDDGADAQAKKAGEDGQTATAAQSTGVWADV